jgi:NitT/TauT family transport system ATP-binding protein
METDPIVRVRNVGLRYPNGTHALADVSLDVPKGKLVTLLGPSGCGKTSLLKIIAGLVPPSMGEIWVNNQVADAPGPDRALVFQDFALMPWSTVLRNVAFGLELRGLSRVARHEIARHYIAEVGLGGCEDKYPHELSGGMRQRVGLARALAVNAEVLMMDEPFSAVDEQMRRKLQEDLLELLRQERKTVIFVTHSIEEAVYLSDRIVLLSRNPGRVTREVEPGFHRDGGGDIRRDPVYHDIVDSIWTSLKGYLN